MLPHEEADCPFKASLYCSSCACYGHSLRTCPDPEMDRPIFRRMILPCFKESKPILELVNDESVLKSFLHSKSRLPPRAIKIAELRKLVALYADEEGYELCLLNL